MKQKIVLCILTLIVFCFLAGAADAVYVDPEVLDEVNSKGKTDVIIVLDEINIEEGKDPGNLITGLPIKNFDRKLTKKERISRIKARVMQKQDKVLDKIKRLENKGKKKKQLFKLRRRFKAVNAFSGEVTQQGLASLASNPDVRAIYKNYILHITLGQTIPIVQADDIWTRQVNGVNLDGAGETICVIDTGVDTDHPGFGSRVIGQYCYCAVSDKGSGGCCPDNTHEDTSCEDDHTHGTHCAGIAAADGSVKGVAKGANIVGVKVCNASGSCSGGDMMAGVDWCVANAATYNISVITMSLGDWSPHAPGTCPTWMDPSISAAVSNGIVFTAASGNLGRTIGIDYPGCSPNATAVGSTDDNDGISSFTNRHPALLKIMAPGRNVISTIPGSYGSKSGTSMATPHVAGAAAIIKQYGTLTGQTFTPAEIEQILIDTGKQVGDYKRIDLVNIFLQAEENSTVNQTENSIRKDNVGKIKFSSATNFENIFDCFDISYNHIELDASQCPEYNKAARLTIEGLPYTDALILKDGNPCPENICSNKMYNPQSGELQFDVTGFSTFSATENGGGQDDIPEFSNNSIVAIVLITALGVIAVAKYKR